MHSDCSLLLTRTLMWTRRLSVNMGFEQADFVKAFVLALSEEEVVEKLESTIFKKLESTICKQLALALGEEEVIKKLESAICGKLSKEVGELRKELHSRDRTISELQSEVGELKTTMDEMEQYSRRVNLRMAGIQERDNENTFQLAMGIINDQVCVAHPISSEEIDRVHRIGRKVNGKPRPIMIRFTTFRARQRVYKNRILLNPKRRHGPPDDPWRLRETAATTRETTGDEVEGAEGGTGTDDRPSHPSVGPTNQQSAKQDIFINEDLTRYRSKLLWQARLGKRGNKLSDCWSADGSVFIKDLRGTVVRIKTMEDLERVINN